MDQRKIMDHFGIKKTTIDEVEFDELIKLNFSDKKKDKDKK